ncbi:hypothetical protein JTB14_000222 [Gonioctena quinquepunctata]|nr:hypothetical protein JTB14_000222 [Gonioctena quinquepunctata]
MENTEPMKLLSSNENTVKMLNMVSVNLKCTAVKCAIGSKNSRKRTVQAVEDESESENNDEGCDVHGIKAKNDSNTNGLSKKKSSIYHMQT